MIKSFLFLETLFIFFFYSLNLKGQSKDSVLVNASLSTCIQYALQNQPLLLQVELDKRINEKTIKSNLAGWLPQIRTEFNLQHYFKLPVSLVPTTADPNGPRRAQSFVLPNVSNWLFQGEQVIYNSDLLLASKAAGSSRQLAEQNIESTRIEVIVNVSKAYYDVLLTEQQARIFEEALRRQQKLLEDSYHQYEVGIVDKLDYKRTSIAMNNTTAELRRMKENVKSKNIALKQMMGYPAERELSIFLDTTQMAAQLSADTNQVLNVNGRIEYNLLKTQQQLQALNKNYYQWSALPTISAFANYNFYYTSREMRDLYSVNYPNSLGGVRVSMPIFQGTRRWQNLQKAKLQLQRTELGLQWVKSSLESQHAQSLATYKSNVEYLNAQQKNLIVAQEVYELVKLQYDHGIKPYLDVITAETDLRNSQVNYLNALYNVLSAKLDFNRALGTINSTSF